MFKKPLFIIFAFFIINLPGFCIETLHFNGFIADNANVISASNEAALNQVLYALQAKTKADIAVVTLNSLLNESIEDAALKIGRKYKVGDKELNNGAVVLVVPNERKARIEIGYGLEGFITDAKAGRILDDYMIPWFKNEHYEKGIIDGTMVLASEIAKAYNVDLSIETPAPYRANNDISTIIFVILFIIMMLKGGGFGGFGGGGYYGGGRSGRIRFGGGGGFGGGGSSRSW